MDPCGRVNRVHSRQIISEIGLRTASWHFGEGRTMNWQDGYGRQNQLRNEQAKKETQRITDDLEACKEQIEEKQQRGVLDLEL